MKSVILSLLLVFGWGVDLKVTTDGPPGPGENGVGLIGLGEDAV